MRKGIRVIVSCLLFFLVLCFALNWVTDILIPKSTNRCYILEKYLEEHPEHNLSDVGVFGSCHAYTSFDPVYLKERTGIDSFVYGNPSEIMPVTYLRMVDQFKKHTPKVVLVETWGINPYDTYIDQEKLFGEYLDTNLELTDFSMAKQEVIRDYEHFNENISPLLMNLPLARYKERLVDRSLTDVDFNYSFEATEQYSLDFLFSEMTLRLNNCGFRRNPPRDNSDYPEKQVTIRAGESAEIEPDIVKYVQKIIDLCKKNDVELIFYRAPYISNENELKKLNHLREICDDNGIVFIDLEEEIPYSYSADFFDYQHLSEAGAAKSTEYLSSYILNALAQSK